MLWINNTLINVLVTAYKQGYSSATIRFYSGTMPTVDANFVWSAANFTSQYLGGIGGLPVTVAAATSGSTYTLNNGTSVAFDATGTGIATWCAIIPNNSDSYGAIIGTVSSDVNSKAAVLLDNVNMVPSTGRPYSMIKATFRIQ